MKRMLSVVIIIGAFVIGSFLLLKDKAMNKQIDVLKVKLGLRDQFPDPTEIDLVGDWYFFDHVSSGLVSFDHLTGKFEPQLAESWVSHESGVHTFTLRSDAKFHDGSPIKASDVVATLKRQLIKKTSTHFPLWEYIEGCEKLKSLSDECSGLKAVSNTKIEIRLKAKADSFFLQLASPETGIWSEEDLLKSSEKFSPTKFSGAYSVASYDTNGARLIRNEFSFISAKFKNSPKEIQCIEYSTSETNQALMDGKLELLIRDNSPFNEPEWEKHGVNVFKSAPTSIIYFQGLDHDGKKLMSKKFLNNLWNQDLKGEALIADSVLPFNKGYSLTKDDILSRYPDTGAKKVKLAVPWTYFSNRLLEMISVAGKESGTDIEIIRLERDAWLDAVKDANAYKKYDFILVPYAASERYPAVQLRFLTESYKKPEIDLKKAESPELNAEKIEILKDYQKWLVENQHVVPLFFLRSQIFHSSQIDIGEQPPSDAEVELWRVTKK